jgi:hypothetical protein
MRSWRLRVSPAAFGCWFASFIAAPVGGWAHRVAKMVKAPSLRRQEPGGPTGLEGGTRVSIGTSSTKLPRNRSRRAIPPDLSAESDRSRVLTRSGFFSAPRDPDRLDALPASRSTDNNRFSAARSPCWMVCFAARCRRYRPTMCSSRLGFRDLPPFEAQSRTLHGPCLHFEPRVAAVPARLGPDLPAAALVGWGSHPQAIISLA